LKGRGERKERIMKVDKRERKAKERDEKRGLINIFNI